MEGASPFKQSRRLACWNMLKSVLGGDSPTISAEFTTNSFSFFVFLSSYLFFFFSFLLFYGLFLGIRFQSKFLWLTNRFSSIQADLCPVDNRNQSLHLPMPSSNETRFNSIQFDLFIQQQLVLGLIDNMKNTALGMKNWFKPK